MDDETKRKIIRYAKGAGRAAGIAVVAYTLKEHGDMSVAGVISITAVYGMVGKLLRDKFPKIFGWLPIL